MPTLVHDGFVLYETGAITRYVDRTFAGPALQPGTPRALARMDQMIGIIDSYGYWPMVRQVFSHRVFRAAAGRPVDEAEIAQGLAGAAKVLAALEALASEPFLAGPELSLADLHVGAMIAYFTLAPEGAALLGQLSAARRVVGQAQPACELRRDRSGPARVRSRHRCVSAFALRPEAAGPISIVKPREGAT